VCLRQDGACRRWRVPDASARQLVLLYTNRYSGAPYRRKRHQNAQPHAVLACCGTHTHTHAHAAVHAPRSACRPGSSFVPHSVHGLPATRPAGYLHTGRFARRILSCTPCCAALPKRCLCVLWRLGRTRHAQTQTRTHTWASRTCQRGARAQRVGCGCTLAAQVNQVLLFLRFTRTGKGRRGWNRHACHQHDPATQPLSPLSCLSTTPQHAPAPHMAGAWPTQDARPRQCVTTSPQHMMF
jgi:hypothetical protein